MPDGGAVPGAGQLHIGRGSRRRHRSPRAGADREDAHDRARGPVPEDRPAPGAAEDVRADPRSVQEDHAGHRARRRGAAVRRPLTDIVRSGGALAGVNGDWFDLGTGIPAHAFAQDGDLLRTTTLGGTGFGVTRDESSVLFENPRVDVTLTDTSTGRTFTIDRWNQGEPTVGELAGFSPLGGTAEPPPRFACSVRLLPLGEPTVAEPDGVNRPYVVDVARCSEDPLARQGGVVISAEPATDEAVELLALEPGTDMRLHWTAGWSNVFDVIGGEAAPAPRRLSASATHSAGATRGLASASRRPARSPPRRRRRSPPPLPWRHDVRVRPHRRGSRREHRAEPRRRRLLGDGGAGRGRERPDPATSRPSRTRSSCSRGQIRASRPPPGRAGLTTRLEGRCPRTP